MTQLEQSRKTWRLHGSSGDLVIVRREDLRDYERPAPYRPEIPVQLQKWLADPLSATSVLEMLECVSVGHRSWTAQDLRAGLPRLEEAFRRGQLAVMEVVQRHGGTGLGSAVFAAPPAPQKRIAGNSIAARAIKHWIAFRVVDEDTDEPVEGVRLKIKLPDGTARDYLTNSHGTIEIANLDKGTCEVSSDLQGVTIGDTHKLVGIW